MILKFFSIISLFFFTDVAFGQNPEYALALIPDSLQLNANAVIRLNQIDIDIASQRDITTVQKRIVTVLNEKGMAAIQAHESYSKRNSVKSIQATVYDAFGKEIKRIKRKDFKDITANLGGGLDFSDDRIIYLDYTPTQYPFTIVYECETQSSNTAFISPWRPIDCMYAAVEKNTFTITCPETLGLRKKEFRFSGYPITKQEGPNTTSYTATNIVAQKREDYSPNEDVIFPKVMFGLEKFNLEGVDGTAKSWKEFGQWYAEKILLGTDELPETTTAKIKALVGNETDPVKKARIIYDYVQQKSRYVSIQVGIGGWKPMPASDVDRLGYGDCKALSNYTRALLKAVDVPSYYTVVYGDKNKRDIDPEFVSMQGNHVMLTVPDGSRYIWLECTSQDNPFGYQAKFTDDRNVLVIKPDGGEILHTRIYSDKTNSQNSKGGYVISETGALTGAISITSEGSQYVNKYQLQTELPTAVEAHYKEYWSTISNLKIKKTTFQNDKEKVCFTENLEIEAANYASLSGGRMIFPLNAYNQTASNIKKVRNRKQPFEIPRGSYDEDLIAIELPQAFSIEAMPQNFEIKGKFGDYKTEILQNSPNHLTYKRTLFIKEGNYSKNEYEDFRNFMDQVSRNDNAKIVLLKKQ